jgi:predicted ArsR family transcriptional regulator
MKSTRQQILELLKNRSDLTAGELSRALMLTQADVRHHLANMVEEGLLVITGHHRSGYRGRPARQYCLAAIALKNNYDLLSSALLSASLESLPQSEQTNLLRRVATALVGEVKPSGPLTQRLIQATGRLNELGYKSRWEAHIDAPRLILGRCPFATLLSQHPELCHLDAYLLEILLGESVSQQSTHTNDHPCIYLIGKN